LSEWNLNPLARDMAIKVGVESMQSYQGLNEITFQKEEELL
jgi:hypothetical protein